MSRAYSNYADIIDFTRASNATIMDSDGLIKWAPHNLLKYSEDLTNTWAGGGVTTTSDTLTSDVSTGFHYVQQGVSADAGTYTFSVKVKANGYNYAVIRLVNDNFSSDRYGIAISLIDGTFVDDTEVGSPVTSYSVSSEADGWYRISVSMNHSTGSFFASVSMNDDATPSWSAGLVSFTGDGTSGVYAKEMHLYRSDLGGMVDNPDRGDSYVPTTSSAVYLSRIEYDADGNLLGLLIEEQRTNLLTYSEAFDKIDWSKVRGDVASESISDPFGGQGAFSWTANEVAESYIFDGATISSGATVTFSAFIKKKTADHCHLLVWDNSANGCRVWFDLVNGQVGTNTSFGSTFVFAGSSITESANGWYRCSMTVTTSGSTTAFVRLQPSNGNGDVNSSVGKSIYIWGAQVEVGSFPTSYIPTSGSTATRSADVASIATSAFGYNDAAGTLYVDGTFRDAETIVTLGSTTIDADADGRKDYTATYSADPSATSIVLNNGLYNSLKYYPRVLTPAQLEALTS